jgi:hypothetical protein
VPSARAHGLARADGPSGRRRGGVSGRHDADVGRPEQALPGVSGPGRAVAQLRGSRPVGHLGPGVVVRARRPGRAGSISWTTAARSRTAAVQAGNYYFFFFLPLLLFFLPFLPFLATPLTPLPDSAGQRNVDQTRQRIIDRERLSTTLTWWPPRVLLSGSPLRSALSTSPTGR